jgi:hypothetical protein
MLDLTPLHLRQRAAGDGDEEGFGDQGPVGVEAQIAP